MKKLGCVVTAFLVSFLLMAVATVTQPPSEGQYLNFFGGKTYDIQVAPLPAATEPLHIITLPKQQAAAQWHVLLAVSGTGNTKTVPLMVPSEWRIQWACDPMSFDGYDYNVIVSVYTTGGVPLDVASVNSMCKKNSIEGTTEEYGGGQVYLDIMSEGAWTLHVTGID